MDKIIIDIVSATTKTKQGDAFTVDNLKQMCNDIHNKDILILENYNKDKLCGRVLSAKVKTNRLFITVTLNKDINEGYIVPGFKVLDAEYDSITDIFTYKDIELLYMGLVVYPADIGVTKW